MKGQDRLCLSRFVLRYVPLYAVAVVAMLVGTLLDMIAPQIVQHITDDVLVARNLAALTPLLWAILAIGAGRFVCQYAKEFLCDWCGSKIASEVRIDLFRKIQGLSAAFFDTINSGELLSRVKDDVDRIWDVAAFMAILIAEVAVRAVSAVYFMVRINAWLAVVPTVAMVACGLIAMRMDHSLSGLFGAVAEENSRLNNVAAENLAGVRTVKAFAREGFEVAKFHRHNQRYYELNIDLSRVFVKFSPIIQLIARGLSFVTMLCAAYFVIRGNPFAGGQRLTVGQMIALTQYVSGLFWPMEMLGWLTNGFSSAKASIKRLDKIYAQVSDIADDSALAQNAGDIAGNVFSPYDITGAVAFEHVTYTAQKPGADSANGTGDRQDILRDVSFSIRAGQTLGIMGATGSGKTTIINLLKRMYNVTSGRILIDGVDITEYPLHVLRQSVACVMQDVFLFSDTIDGNVRLGAKESMTTAEVRAALVASHSAEFVDHMPERENTVIGERGVGLSGGQKQRITIARALARKVPILVLDDSTSALDTETEQEIQQVLASLTGMTKIIIAHRISAVRKADKILVLDGGRVAESGTHEELMARGGLYRETYDSQYGGTT